MIKCKRKCTNKFGQDTISKILQLISTIISFPPARKQYINNYKIDREQNPIKP